MATDAEVHDTRNGRNGIEMSFPALPRSRSGTGSGNSSIPAIMSHFDMS